MHKTGSLRECAICCNDTPVDAIIVIEGDSACHGCVRQIFQFAVESEKNFPPVWAGQPLKLEDYAYILDAGLTKEFRRKTEQYSVPWDQRVVCRRSEIHADTHSNDVFVGRSQTTQINAPCPECGILYCLRCSQDVAEHDAEQHSCRPAETTPHFQELKQGVDYQLCPGCKSAVQLQGGCNHIACVCTQQFCFVCGQPATNDSNHWVRGRCPRYNHAIITGGPLWQEDIDELVQRQWEFQFGRTGRALPRASTGTIGRRNRGAREVTRQTRTTRAARVAAVAALERARQLGRFARERVPRFFWQQQEQQGSGAIHDDSLATPAPLAARQQAQDALNTARFVHATEESALRIPQSQNRASNDSLAGTRRRIGVPPQPFTSRMGQTMIHHLPMHQPRPSHANNRVLASALQADFAALSTITQNEDPGRASLHYIRPQAQTDFQSLGEIGRLQSLSVAGSLLDHHRHAHPQHIVTGTTSAARDHEHARHAERSEGYASSLTPHHGHHGPIPAVDVGRVPRSRIRPSDAIGLPHNMQQGQSHFHAHNIRH